jgi:hypothetical protein
MSTLGGLPGGGLASRALEYFVPDYILLVRD